MEPGWLSPKPAPACRSSSCIPHRSIVTTGVRSSRRCQASGPSFPISAATAHPSSALRFRSARSPSFPTLPSSPWRSSPQTSSHCWTIWKCPRHSSPAVPSAGTCFWNSGARLPNACAAWPFVCSKPQPDAEANLVKRAATIAQARSEGVAALFDGMAQSLIGATAHVQRPDLVSELRARMTLTTEALVAVQAGLATRPDSIPTVAHHQHALAGHRRWRRCRRHSG